MATETHARAKSDYPQGGGDGALEVELLTPEARVFRGDARSVILPVVDGELGVYPRHAPLIAALGTGELRLSPADGSSQRHFVVYGGVAQVQNDRVVILATKAEDAGGIDVADAADDLERARGRKAATAAEHTSKREAVLKARVRHHAAKRSRG